MPAKISRTNKQFVIKAEILIKNKKARVVILDATGAPWRDLLVVSPYDTQKHCEHWGEQRFVEDPRGEDGQTTQIEVGVSAACWSSLDIIHPQ